MTTDDKVAVIAQWYDGKYADPALVDWYKTIEYLWPVAKKVVEKCTEHMKDTTKTIEWRQHWAPTAAKVTVSLSALSEEKLLDALYEAVVKLNEYQKEKQ